MIRFYLPFAVLLSFSLNSQADTPLLNPLAVAQAAQNDRSALQQRLEQLTALEKSLGENHAQVMPAAEALADAYVEAKQANLAVPLYFRVIQFQNGLPEKPPASLTRTITKIMQALNAAECASFKMQPYLDVLFPIAREHQVNVFELNIFMLLDILRGYKAVDDSP